MLGPEWDQRVKQSYEMITMGKERVLVHIVEADCHRVVRFYQTHDNVTVLSRGHIHTLVEIRRLT